MPKKSYKIEFVNKQEMLGMPKDRDWVMALHFSLQKSQKTNNRTTSSFTHTF